MLSESGLLWRQNRRHRPAGRRDLVRRRRGHRIPVPKIVHTGRRTRAYSSRSVARYHRVRKTAELLWATRGGDVNIKTIAGWAAIAFVVWWVIQQPTNAAHLVHNIGTFLSSAATGFSHFVSSI
jgi:hypothetical protein